MNDLTHYDFLADLFRYPQQSRAAWQELYTRTFDVQAVCYLDVGYVLFGEDYKRGHFLVKMDELQRQYENNCGTELSDHLPNVLTLLTKMGKTDETSDFVQKLLLPALDKMLQGFSQKGSIYETLLQALRDVLVRDFSMDAATEPLPTKTVLQLPVVHDVEGGLHE